MFTSYDLRALAGLCLLWLTCLPAFSQTILINELYADPNPKGTLVPAEMVLPTVSGAEFVEIINPGATAYDCFGCSLSGKAMPDFTIPAGGYLILCPEAYADQYAAFGEVLTLPSWNTLSNGGERVYLVDNMGLVLDELTYSSTWHSTGKASGGWSLERINPLLNCSSESNWTSSVSPYGATPGTANSVEDKQPDLQAPTLIEARWDHPDSLVFTFSEPVSPGQISSAPNLSLSVLEAGTDLIVLVQEPSQAGITYTFTLQDIRDCEGNIMAPLSISLAPDITPPSLASLTFLSADRLSLVFTEAVNPEALSPLTFSYYCDLSVSGIIQNEENPAEVVLQNNRPFTYGEQCQLQISNIRDKAGNAASFSYPIHYVPALDTAWTEDPGIVSVSFTERPVNILSAENYFLNGFGASPFMVLDSKEGDMTVQLIFSPAPASDVAYSLEVRNMQAADGRELITPAVEVAWDTKPPLLTNYEWVSADTISLFFNEALDPARASIAAHYEFTDLEVSPCRIVHRQPEEVQLVYCERLPQETSLRMRIHSLADAYGNIMSRSRYIDLSYDATPPAVVQARQLTENELALVLSESVDTAYLHPGNFIWQGLSSAPAAFTHFTNRDKGDSIHFTFQERLPHTPFTLKFTDLQDYAGNRLTDTLTVTFDNTTPRLGYARIDTDTSINLAFTHALSASDFLLGEAYISGVPVTDWQITSQGHLRLLMPFRLTPGDIYTLSIPRMLIGDQALSVSRDMPYRIPAIGFTIAGSRLIRLYIQETLEAPLDVALYSVNGSTPSLVWQDHNVLYLLLETPLIPGSDVEVSAGPFTDHQGTYWPHFRLQGQYDLTPPIVVSAIARLHNELVITFSKAVDYASALSPYHYQIGGQPPIRVIQQNEQTVSLALGQSLIDDQSYTLQVSGIRDQAGNSLSDTTIAFTFRAPTDLAGTDLIISEILPRPLESSGHSREFVELMNVAADTLYLRGLQLADRTTVAQIPDFMLPPGGYMLLCAMPDTAVFSHLPNKLGLHNWPSLNDTNDELFLLTITGDTLNSIYFSASVAAEGQSLERTNTTASCGGPSQWLPTTHPEGHTAGRVNTVPVTTQKELPPGIAVARIVDDRAIIIYTDKALAADLLPSQVKLSTEEGIALTIEALVPLSPTSFRVQVASSLDLQKTYRLDIIGLEDCQGNRQEVAHYSPVIYPESPRSGDIILSEILFNPYPGGVDFIELYNTSEEYLDLSGLYLIGASQERELGIDRPVIMAPGSYLAFTPDPAVLARHYPGAAYENIVRQVLPTMPDDEGLAGLMYAGETYEVVAYHETFHNRLLQAREGVSLERVNGALSAEESTSWASAAAGAGYATPGLPNSQEANQGATANESLQLSAAVITPDFDGVDDYVDISYMGESGGMVLNAWVYDMNGTKVATLATGSVAGTAETLRWEGQTDRGDVAPTGYYLVVLEVFNAGTKRETLKAKIGVSGI